MKKAGQVVLFNFPQTDFVSGKLRPALLLARLPGGYDDWLRRIRDNLARWIKSDEESKEGGLSSAGDA